MSKKIERPGFQGPIEPSPPPKPKDSSIEKVRRSVRVPNGAAQSPHKKLKAKWIEPPTHEVGELRASRDHLVGKIQEQKTVVESANAVYQEKKNQVLDLEKHLQAPDFPEPARENYADILRDAQTDLAQAAHRWHKETAQLHIFENALHTVEETIAQSKFLGYTENG